MDMKLKFALSQRATATMIKWLKKGPWEEVNPVLCEILEQTGGQVLENQAGGKDGT